MALQYLRQGNERFAEDRAADRNLSRQRDETRDGQVPFAAILGCVDGRTPPTLIFDQGLGDLVAVRLAGNVVTDEGLGSLEFACATAGAKLVVVLGHSKCAAVESACDGVRLGNLSTLLARIRPAIDLERTVAEHRNGSNPQFVDKVARINVECGVREVIEGSPVLRDLVEKEVVGVIGAMYDVDTGRVTFLEETFLLGAATLNDFIRRSARG